MVQLNGNHLGGPFAELTGKRTDAGTSDYGAFSVYMQYYTQPELLFDVPPDCFLPAPKVTSAVVRCKALTAPPVAFSCGDI